jgi:radical SAM superfamily enzyme YgiQ (UPF0313 family)
MRILFITDPFQVESLGIAYLASVLKKKGHDVDLIKTDVLNFEDIKKFYPHIIAFSVTTGKHRHYLEIARNIKSVLPVLSVFGGAHPTYFPEFVNERGVDVIVRGEAEKSFVEFLDDWQLRRKFKRIVNFRTLEENIDRIPFPDREFLYKYPENRNNPIKNVITSRGCHFNCHYCYNSLYRSFYQSQNWVRYRSPENVIEECLGLKKYPTRFIFFQDDEFLTNPNFFELLSLYKEKVKIPFHCQIRIELLTEEKASALKEAGCSGVTFAVECGNYYLRKNLLNRPMTDEQILKGVELLKKYKLKIRTENMLGLPGESLSQMLETLDLNIKIKPLIAWASIFQPYPRLPLSNYAYKNEFWDGRDDFKENFFENTVLNFTAKKQLRNLQRYFALIVNYPFLRKFIWQIMNLPEGKFGLKFYKWYKNKQYKLLFR